MKRFAAFFMLTVMLQVFSVFAQDNPTDSPPEALPLVNEGAYDIVNFLLLGSDTANPQNAGRTDVLLIVSVNQTEGTVALLSLPRDLYVYVPDWQMNKINTVYGYGENHPVEGGGSQLLIDTIRYNLGLEIDHYARVDFNDFKTVIDSLGGIEISVDCALQDWRLRDPDLDPTIEDNWAMFTLPVGVHQMDGDLALWYVRSRRTSSDFDRGRRQQDIMRAVWRRIRELDLLNQLPDIWMQVNEMVETDVALQDMLTMSSLALTIDSTRIVSYRFRPNIEVMFGTSPEGSSILVPVPEAVIALTQQMVLPPTERLLVQEHPTIEVINASGIPGLDRVAADRLAWEGFIPRIAAAGDAANRQLTVIYDYTGQTKGSSLNVLTTVLRVSDSAVIVEPDPNRAVDFRVQLGSSYSSCTYDVMPPSEDD